jgi:protein kinase
VLGDGAFGTVYKAVNSKTGEVVAIKKMKAKYTSWEECLELREIKSLRKLSHPTIIKLKEVLLVSEQLHMVFEYLETNLYEDYSARKKEQRPFSEKEVK